MFDKKKSFGNFYLIVMLSLVFIGQTYAIDIKSNLGHSTQVIGEINVTDGGASPTSDNTNVKLSTDGIYVKKNIGIGIVGDPTAPLDVNGLIKSLSLTVAGETRTKTLVVTSSTNSASVEVAGLTKTNSLEVTNEAKVKTYCDENGANCFVADDVGKSKTEIAGLTTAKYDGSLNDTNGGYIAANLICNTQYAGSKVCTSDQILVAIKKGVFPTSGAGWIFNGPPGYVAQANDCNGWTDKDGATDHLGAWWDFDAKGGAGKLTTCNAEQPFWCCE